jgi:hypothetical protein
MVHQYLNERGEPAGHDSGPTLNANPAPRAASAQSDAASATLSRRAWGANENDATNLQLRVISAALPDRSGSDAQRYLLTSCVLQVEIFRPSIKINPGGVCNFLQKAAIPGRGGAANLLRVENS